MAFEKQAMLLHQPVDAFGVDRGPTVGSRLALEELGVHFISRQSVCGSSRSSAAGIEKSADDVT
jgi:hypothetical protein